MDERSTGLIVRVRPLTESSLIVHWITQDLGRVATVAKGARRPNSPFRGKLDLFYLAELSFRRSRKSDLHSLLEIKLKELHSALRQDWVRLQHCAYAATLVEQLTETDTPIPELFQLLSEFVGHLAQHPAHACTLLGFETKTMQLLGVDPTYHPAPLEETCRQLLERLGESDWPSLQTLPLTSSQTSHISQFIQTALANNLHRIPKSRAAAFRALE